MTVGQMLSRVETLVALDLLGEFMEQNFFAEVITGELIAAMHDMVTEYLKDMEIYNVQLDAIRFEQCMPVLMFSWTDIDYEEDNEYAEFEAALAKVEYRTMLEDSFGVQPKFARR